MAKTFKHLAHPAAGAAKPVSERDFFDLTDEETTPPAATGPTPPPIPKAVGKRNTGKPGNTNNDDNTSKPPATAGGQRAIAKLAAPLAAPDAGRDVRQTFVLSEQHLEQLRDFVHARRAGGDYLYSQKQALQEALELLFATASPAAPRPAQLREREQQRRTRIQRGRTAGREE